MLNKYVWNNYLKSGGSDVVEMFNRFICGHTENYALGIRQLVSRFCPMELELNRLQDDLEDLFEDYDLTGSDKDRSCDDSIDILLDDLYDDIRQNMQEYNSGQITDQEVFGCFVSNLPYYTTLYAWLNPDCLVPYFFRYTFNVLQIIADQFDIELPPIPVKRDYLGRFRYYGEICKALIRFRRENDLSPQEMWAFLYDFAPNYIGGTDSYIIKDLPEPRSAFFIGSSEDDVFLSEPSGITAWQCNEHTRVGDMILMYMTSPVSAVSSVWRACSIGFIDPFFWYYRCAYIVKQTDIDRVTLKAMRNDPVIAQMSIVRKNMQGVNGVELLPSEYNRLVDMAGAKNVFHFVSADNPVDGEICRERDVEDKLIKPLLVRLGYTKDDYVQQLYIEIGNHNHALIPDFVLLPDKTNGHVSAFAIIEAKKSIPSEKMLNETKKQARSYAIMLKVRYSVIASKEKVWVTSARDDYSETVFEAAWTEIKNPDVFHTFEKLLGLTRDGAR